MGELFNCPRKKTGLSALVVALEAFAFWVWCEAHPTVHFDRDVLRHFLFSFFITPMTLLSAYLLLSKPRPTKLPSTQDTIHD